MAERKPPVSVKLKDGTELGLWGGKIKPTTQGFVTLVNDDGEVLVAIPSAEVSWIGKRENVAAMDASAAAETALRHAAK